MAAAIVDDVVSPELALVDPELAARARTALSNAASVERPFAIGFEFVPEELLYDDAVTNPRRRVMPLLVVASVVAVSIVGGAALRGGPSVGTSESWSASGTTPVVASASGDSPASEAPHSRVGDVTTEAPNLVARVSASVDELQPQALDTTSLTRAPMLSAPNAVAPIVAAHPTALVWDDLGDASSYEVELVRDGSQIFSVSSRSPAVDVPRSWTHDGERFAVQPEDRVFVWPVVDGQRASRPIVNGTQVFDNTLLARFTG